MKRISFWFLSTFVVVVLMFSYHTSTAGTLATAGTAILGPTSGGGSTSFSASGPPADTSGSGSGTSAGTGSGSGSSSGSGTGSGSGSGTGSGSGSTSQSKSSSSTVQGGVAQTMFGPVQVELTVSNRKITNVKILQYPHGNGRDIQIDQYVFPILMKETITAQSANIQMISGATYTSDGYIRSLQSALDKAGI